MNDEYWLWDKLNDEWNGNIFHDFDLAEEYAMEHGGYDRYVVFERLS